MKIRRGNAVHVGVTFARGTKNESELLKNILGPVQIERVLGELLHIPERLLLKSLNRFVCLLLVTFTARALVVGRISQIASYDYRTEMLVFLSSFLLQSTTHAAYWHGYHLQVSPRRTILMHRSPIFYFLGIHVGAIVSRPFLSAKVFPVSACINMRLI